MLDHWRGRHGFAWSFWVNFVLLRVILFAAQEAAAAVQPAGPDGHPVVIMALVVLFHGAVFLWQAVGTLRAAEAYIRGSGQMFTLWGTQLSLIFAAFWVLSYSLEAWHLTRPDPEQSRPTEAELNAARAAKYDLRTSGDGTVLLVEGSLELGITEAFRAQLETLPSISEITLTSEGGNIYEARGLAAIIRDLGLSTKVLSTCSSACTIAFISGKTRRVTEGATLGFHRYRVDANYAVLGADPEREQARDLDLFRAAGVAPWFLDRIYESAANEMWYPSQEDLLASGVAHEVMRTGATPD